MPSMTAKDAMLAVEQLLREVQPVLDSAIRFHQVRREAPESAEGTFAGARARQTPVDHAHRAEICKNNKNVIDSLRDRVDSIAKAYGADE